MTANKNRPEVAKEQAKKEQKKKTIGEQRDPPLTLPPTDEEFTIVSPGVHVPPGQTTHE